MKGCFEFRKILFFLGLALWAGNQSISCFAKEDLEGSVATWFKQPDFGALFVDKNFKKYFSYLDQKLDQGTFQGDPFFLEMKKRSLKDAEATLLKQKYTSRLYVELSSIIRKQENLPQYKKHFRIYFLDPSTVDCEIIMLLFSEREGGDVKEFFNEITGNRDQPVDGAQKKKLSESSDGSLPTKNFENVEKKKTREENN